MKKLAKLRLLYIVLSFVGILSSILLSVVFFGYYVRWKYAMLLLDPTLSTAILAGDAVQLESGFSQHSLDFQRIVDGVIVDGSSSWLPHLSVASIQTTVSTQVLPMEQIESLRQQVPYTYIYGYKVYIIFPILLDDSGLNGYLVYSRVL